MKVLHIPTVASFVATALILSGCHGSSSTSTSGSGAGSLPPPDNGPVCEGVAITPERVLLQQLGSDRVLIKWRSSQLDRLSGNEATEVCFGTDPSALPASSLASAQVTETGHSEVLLEGLSPDTRYYYSIGGAPTTDLPYSFRTAPVKGSLPADGNVRVWVLGDAGTALYPQNEGLQEGVRDGYKAWVEENGGEPADVVLMLGDNAYFDGTDYEFQAQMFDIYPDILASTGTWSTIGNHEMGQFGTSTASSPDQYVPVTGLPDAPPDSPMPYLNIFSFPTQGEAGGVPSGTEQYYSFDYGNIHFISLDSQLTARDPSSREAMKTWLIADLQANTSDWTIVFYHHPPYTKGTHDSDDPQGGVDQPHIDMRVEFTPVFEEYGVDLIYGGHSHTYERSGFICGHTGTSDTFVLADMAELNDAGEMASGQDTETYSQGSACKIGTGLVKAVYTVAGSSGQGGGAGASAPTLDHPANFYSSGDIGSVVIDANHTMLTATFVDDNGEALDHFTITR